MHTTPDYTITTPAGDRLVPGTVFVFTADLTFMGPRWRNRILGAHMVVTGYSSSGYCIEVRNTYTGRSDALTIERWWLRDIRVITQVDPSQVEED